MKRSKTFRGNKSKRLANYNPCGCFYCAGHTKGEINKLKYQHLLDVEEMCDTLALAPPNPDKYTMGFDPYIKESDNDSKGAVVFHLIKEMKDLESKDVIYQLVYPVPNFTTPEEFKKMVNELCDLYYRNIEHKDTSLW